VTFIPSPISVPQNDPSWKSLDLAVTYKVPSATTTYACTTHVLTFPDDVHIVKFELMLNETNHPWVHHILVYRCTSNDTDWYVPQHSVLNMTGSQIETGIPSLVMHNPENQTVRVTK
jgi:hypothetical protein